MRSVAYLILTIMALPSMVQAQEIVTPVQAIQSVRLFCGDPVLDVTVQGPFDEGPASFDGVHYKARAVAGPWRGLYTVRAEDGAVLDMCLEGGPLTDPPTISMAQAQAIAEAFVRVHYPAFDQRQWSLCPEHYRYWGAGEYLFEWKWILNAFGAVAPVPLRVEVHGTTGKVTYFQTPLERIIGPTVPLVSLEQTEAIAAPFAPYDPQLVPFTEVSLQLYESMVTGVQYLQWLLTQYPEAGNTDLKAFVTIDAITGEVVSVLWMPFGGGPGAVGRGGITARSSSRPVPSGPSLRRAAGKAVAADLRHQGNTLWMRVESLRSLGARVSLDKQLEVRLGNRVLTAGELAAEKRDYGWWAKVTKPVGCPGWWVPVRKAAEALGWRVEWVASRREVVIHTGAR